MSDGGTFTQTGVAELKRSIDRFSDDQTAALKAVARATAERILARERQLLSSQTHGAGNTADALFIEEDAANKQLIVRFGLIKKRPANIPVWLEYGTVQMTARPFIRPAADAEKERYRRDMEAASAAAGIKTFGA